MSKALLNVALIAQSAGLAANSLNLVKKKKKKASDFAYVGATNLIGSALIKEQADFIGSM